MLAFFKCFILFQVCSSWKQALRTATQLPTSFRNTEPTCCPATASQWRPLLPLQWSCPGLTCCGWRCLAPQAMTTPSMPRSRKRGSTARAALRAATMRTRPPSASPSTSAQPTARAVWPSTASSAPMGRCSTRSTLSASTGSMWTAPRQRAFMASMMRLAGRRRQGPPHHRWVVMRLPQLLHQLLDLLLLLPQLLIVMAHPVPG